MDHLNANIPDEAVEGNDSPNTVSESALDQNRPVWVAPSEQRETQSNQSFAEWQKANPTFHDQSNPFPRPHGGTSRRNLVQQIEQLEVDKSELQARLNTLMNPESKDEPSSSNLMQDGTDGAAAATSSTIKSAKSKRGGDSNLQNFTPDFPSTFASSNPESDESQHEYLEQVITLAGKLRMALGPDDDDSSETVKSTPFTLLDRPELKEMLLRATPHPERANHYAHIFAKRSLELYKLPKNRSSMLQAGPLQKTFKHPRYVDILAKCLREPFIAHMGKFDEREFCLWLVTETDFHEKKELNDKGDDDVADDNGDELDDSCYEFSPFFLKRFPFAGTRQLIRNTNVWREQRGEDAIVQTKEMIEAEDYTNSMQIEAATLPSQY